MLKIILDTNVIIAARRSRNGASFQLVSMIGKGQFELIMSVALALEYEYVLNEQFADVGMDKADISDFVSFLCANSLRYEVKLSGWPITADLGDEFIARLALTSGCDFLVTHNIRHLGAVTDLGIKLVTPKQFLPIIRNQS
ncbi:MAG TPA: putative toxin-antitoxin system toxin component, PIN family [Tepidisphaeraceae bacterium]|jgi:putative PIN family toxin of toxin-antitoxin system